jgi:cellulose synthase operon protein YhjQ
MAESNPTTQKSLSDPGEVSTPEDVATLYSWANLHGAKYRDFSASRAQAREEARLRVEEALAEQRRKEAEEAERRAQEEAQIAAREAAEAAEAARQAEAERLAEIARQAEAERQAVLAAQEAQRQAAQQRAWQPAPSEAYHGASPSPLDFSETGHDFARYGERIAASESAKEAGAPPSFGPLPEGDKAAVEKRDPERPAPQRPAQAVQPVERQFQPQPPPPSVGTQGTMYTAPVAHYPELAASGFAAEPYREPFLPGHPSAVPQPYSALPWMAPEPAENRDVAPGPAWLAPEVAVRQAARQPASSAAPNPYPAEPAPSSTMRQTQFFGQGPVAPSAAIPAANKPAHSAQFRGSAPPSYAPQATLLNPPQNPGQPQNPNQGPARDSGLVEDTLLGSRDRIANRWYALKGVFDPQAAPEQVPAPPPARVPVLAVFSLAGGVGKTCLVASLGRALSSRGERVLLVDTAAYGLLPFFFGARDQRPGQLRTFNPPGVSADAPIQLVTFDPESRPQEYQTNPSNAQADPQAANQDWLGQEVIRYARGSHRALIDLPTASGATTRRILRLAPIVLVPVLPDMNSVVSVGAIEGFFRNQASQTGIQTGGQPVMPYYVLNQFDYSLPLHLDVREILREQIGDRLIPFALRRSPSISEALAEGMTVMDYAPNAVVAEDYANLAEWVRAVSAPAAQSYRGVRWSER